MFEQVQVSCISAMFHHLGVEMMNEEIYDAMNTFVDYLSNLEKRIQRLELHIHILEKELQVLMD